MITWIQLANPNFNLIKGLNEIVFWVASPDRQAHYLI
jgi:hypothetical protein